MRPDMYKKSIWEINYDLLKNLGIKVLLFDFDNTILEKTKADPDPSLIKLFNKIKQDFEVIIISNTWKNKLAIYAKKHQIDYVMRARKPSSFGFLKVEDKTGYKEKDICIIGDQIFTDIKGGKKRGYFTVLVDPIKKDPSFFTRFNRLREKYVKIDNFKKGDYYE